jgi:cytochrome c biogenesis protein
LPALVAAIAALAGLLVSFLVRRRRVFVRATPGAGGGAAVEFGGLARTESSSDFGAEFEGLSKDLSAALAVAGEHGPHGNVPPGTTPSGTSPTTHAAAALSADSAAPANSSASPKPAASADLLSSPDERE